LLKGQSSHGIGQADAARNEDPAHASAGMASATAAINAFHLNFMMAPFTLSRREAPPA
jgi:hypothetical protein